MSTSKYLPTYLYVANIERKNNDTEKHFKKYIQKWRLGNANLLTSIRNIFRKVLGRSSKCHKYKEL